MRKELIYFLLLLLCNVIIMSIIISLVEVIGVWVILLVFIYLAIIIIIPYERVFKNIIKTIKEKI